MWIWCQLIAISCGLICLPITHLFFNYLYLSKTPQQACSIYQTVRLVIDSQEPILIFIMIVTYLIKPIFMYGLVLILMTLLKVKYASRIS